MSVLLLILNGACWWDRLHEPFANTGSCVRSQGNNLRSFWLYELKTHWNRRKVSACDYRQWRVLQREASWAWRWVLDWWWCLRANEWDVWLQRMVRSWQDKWRTAGRSNPNCWPYPQKGCGQSFLFRKKMAPASYFGKNETVFFEHNLIGIPNQ